MSSFLRGFSLDLATAVAGGDPDDESTSWPRSSRTSLVRAVGLVAGEPRYLLLESVRTFGLERPEAHVFEAGVPSGIRASSRVSEVCPPHRAVALR
jgi:hypothetical protein